MTDLPKYTLVAVLSRNSSEGAIHRGDGATVTLSGADVSALLVDIAIDDTGRQGDAAHRWRTLRDWFWRKSSEMVGGAAVAL